MKKYSGAYLANFEKSIKMISETMELFKNVAEIQAISSLNDISIVIVNYNSEAVIADCIKPFQYIKNLGADPANQFKYSSVDFIRNNFPKASLAINNKYFGYGKDFNVGLSLIKTKCVLALTPDARISFDDLERQHYYADSYLDSGIVTPLLNIPRLGIETWVMEPNQLQHHRANFEPARPFCVCFLLVLFAYTALAAALC